MSADNIQSQTDETGALAAIYGEDFTLNDDGTFDLRICCDDIKWWAVTISVYFTSNYPEKEPPVFEIQTECLAGNELEEIYAELNKLWMDNFGSNILYIWVEKIRDYLFEKYEKAKLFIESSEEDRQRDKNLTDLMRSKSEMEKKVCERVKPEQTVSDGEVPDIVSGVPDIVSGVPDIVSGETITLKKSTFQAHVASVHTVGEVKLVLHKLKENPKVAKATHNIVAYRLSGVNSDSFVQDYADDGEVNAGGRVLHLLQIMDVKDIVVVVSRWYGGILLGPDRFRLINNCAREAIMKSGCYNPKQEKKKHKKK